MSFLGGNKQQAQATVQTTAGGVPVSAIARLRRMRGEGGPALFTSDLSVAEFALLKELAMEPLGLVVGSSIYHVGFQAGGLFQNQELEVLSRAMYHARELAMTRLQEEAWTLGADGVVGVRLEVASYEWSVSALEFTAIGTAIKAPEGASFKAADGKPFTCDLSVQDFYRLHEVGYVPAELVMGSCVYHIAHQGFAAAMRTMGNNVELTNYTGAIYDAREIAMTRMQSEAESHGAEGIVGATVSQRSHIWESHVMEFLAIGTSIVRRHPSKGVKPAFVLGMDA